MVQLLQTLASICRCKWFKQQHLGGQLAGVRFPPLERRQRGVEQQVVGGPVGLPRRVPPQGRHPQPRRLPCSAALDSCHQESIEWATLSLVNLR
jgi:hypothetical protein